MPARSDDHLDPYREAVAHHGPGFAATLWQSRESQQLRFDVMIGMANLAGMRLLDAGCATGDLADRLIERRVSFASYLGVDALPELIAAASKRKLANCTFRTHDIAADRAFFRDADADYILFSGTLNTMDESLARQVVADAFQGAQRGVIFNFLSNRPHPSWHGKDLGPSRRFDTVAWLDWALEQTPLVSFEQRYLEGHDATVVMERA